MKTHWYLILLSVLLFNGSYTYGQGSIPSSPNPWAPQYLDSRITAEGYVHLFWDNPTQPSAVADLRYFQIQRKPTGTPPSAFSIIANVSNNLEFTDRNVIPGESYDYWIDAFYFNNASAFATVTVAVPILKGGIRFTSTPEQTAKVGVPYQYKFEVQYNPEYTSLDFVDDGRLPEGAELREAVDFTGIVWIPEKAGTYEFTVTAYVTDNELEITYKTSQVIHVVVGDKSTGTIKVRVKSGIGDINMPGSDVRFFVFPDEFDETTFTVRTYSDASKIEPDDYYRIDNVPAGMVFAFVYPSDNRYGPQFYAEGVQTKKIDEATPLRVDSGGVLSIEFELLETNTANGLVAGYVKTSNGSSVENANAHFIRKSNFIHIGDDPDSREDLTVLESWHDTVIDTTVVSDADGYYQAYLPIGIDYFVVIEKDGYYDCFDRSLDFGTNALTSRAIKVESNRTPVYEYQLNEKSQTLLSITGEVRRDDNGINKNAVVFLIEDQLKTSRGVGGGGTYKKIRSVMTDSLGRYIFENVEPNENGANGYVLLAVPMDRDVVPQYYNPVNNAITLENSERINIQYSLDGKDFKLKKAINSGFGSIYGKVALKDSIDEIRYIGGSLVYAVNNLTNEVAGYAVSDSSGWYSIPNLQPGIYTMVADHPGYGADSNFFVPVEYENIQDPGRSRSSQLEIPYKGLLNPSSVSNYNPEIVPNEIVLYQNYPNPFNPATNIKFGLSRRANIKLSVLNTLGQTVQVLEEGVFLQGTHTVQFDASSLPSGMYFYQLSGDGKVYTKSMMLVK